MPDFRVLGRSLGRTALALCALLVIAGRLAAVEPQVAAGYHHSAYLADNGTVWCWGNNAYGQLGNGTTTSSTTPVQVRIDGSTFLTDIVAISTGFYHTVALRSDGSVWTWGYNTYGQLGNNTTTNNSYALRVMKSATAGDWLANVKAISAGGYLSVALLADGKARAWGMNLWGQAGVNHTGNVYVASLVQNGGSGDLGGIRQVAAGYGHMLALLQDGTIRAWGYNAYGQLGDNSTTNAVAPVVVRSTGGGVGTSLQNVQAIAAGVYHSAAISGGIVHTWGYNNSGQIGDGSTTNRLYPLYLGYWAKEVACAYDATYFLQPWSYLYGVGRNNEGQLARDTSTTSYTSIQYLGAYARLMTGASSYHAMAIRSSGIVDGCGQNNYGQIGTGSASPVAVTTMTVASAARWPVANIAAIANGQHHSTALKSDGTVWGWGYNASGQLGNGTNTNASTPVQSQFTDIVALAIGSDFADYTVALRFDGQVQTVGLNNYGQLGEGTTTSSSAVRTINATIYAKSIAAGDYHALAVGYNNNVYSWGRDANGQLGNDVALTNQSSPVLVVDAGGSAIGNIVAVAAGTSHSLALTATGAVYAWGGNGSGQLGDGTLVDKPRAVLVPGMASGVVAIAAGGYHSMALRSDGTVWTWGNNTYGQLGNNTTSNASSPVQVRIGLLPVLTNAKAIGGGSYFSYAVTADGTLYSWGWNGYGQLGNGGTGNALVATASQVGGALAADGGYIHGMALRSDGTVRCFGYGSLGQLGDGNASNSSSPVQPNREWLPLVTISATDSDAGESGPNTGTYQVSRTLSTAGALTVSYAMSGNATSGSDYVAPAGTVIIPAGSATATVVLTPINDDEDEVEEIEQAQAGLSADVAAYRIGAPSSALISITDNDTAGIAFQAIAGQTFEADNNTTPRTFQVRLNSRPTANVTISFASSVPIEAQIDTNPLAGNQGASSLTFLPAEWNTPKTVSVFGQQDSVDDGDITFIVQTTGVTSTDGKYNGIVASDQTWSNVDDDIAGVTISAISGPVTEAGGSATFTIRLDSQPTDRVDFTLATSDATEGTLAPGSDAVSLDAGNWSSGVTITLTGVDDQIDDGDVAFTVQIAKSQSNDGNYNNRGGWDVAASCTDNDTRGVVLSTTSVASDEDGTPTGSFTVRLATQPIGVTPVIITFTGDSQAGVDTDAGTVGNQSTVSFTASDWNTAKTVAVPAVNDFLIEGAHVGTITGAVSAAGTDYAGGVTVSNITCTVGDDDTAGFTLAPATTAGSRQNTSEPAVSANFSVRLNTQPPIGKTVTVKLRSNDVSEGRLSPAVIGRTTTGTDGATERLIFAGGTDLSGVAVGDWVWIVGAGSNNDVQAAVSAVDDASDTITLAYDLANEAGAQNVAIFPRLSLTFTSANWSTPQSVTVTGQDDAVIDTVGQQNYQIQFEVDTSVATHDANYTSGTAPTHWMKNLDDDIPGLSIAQSSGSTEVAEGSGTDSFTVALTTAPGSPVTVTIASGSQVTVDKTALFFTASNWNSAQTVTVTAVEDAVDEASPHTGSIAFITASSDVNYGGLTIDDIVVSIADNDTAGINVIPISGLATTENGGAASFSVSLASQPAASVDIGIASQDTGEGTVSAATLTFTAANWFMPQTVVITGVNDDVDDGDVAYTITTADAVSADPFYSGMASPDVAVTNVDNDTVGVTITQSGGSTVATEVGATDTYTVVLATEPTSDVTVTVSPGSQCTVTPGSLIFTASNWDTPQQVTAGAINDAFAEGAHVGLISHTASGGGYGGVAISSVSVAITDNDTAGVTVSPGAVTCTELGGTGTFTVVLTSQPTANVSVLLASSDTTEGTVSPATLTFTPANYNVAQTVTVSGVDDFLDDGDIAFTVSFALVSADSTYNNFAVSAKAVTCTDNDGAGFTVSAVSGSPTEAGGQATFSVRLTSQPTAAVTVGVASGDTGEATVNPPSLTFDATNWFELQYVTVSGVDDALNDGDIAVTIALSGDESSLDDTYSGGVGAALDPADVNVTTIDNDSAGVAVSTPTLTTAENGSIATFSVVLLSEPTDDVVIPVSSSNPGEATVSPASLTFTAGNWNISQSVTVTPVDDFQVDGAVAYTIVLGACTGADTTGYGTAAALDPADVSGTSNDDDTAGFAISAASGSTTEAGGTATFTVVLTSQPTADVTIAIGGLDATEGSLSATTLTFSSSSAPAANAWNTAQTVTVTGVDDDIDDGDVTYSLTLTPSSGDGVYAALSAGSRSITNDDDDADGVTIVQSAGSTSVDEAGGSDTYTIVLNARPQSGPVTITVTPDSQVRVNGSAVPVDLVFDPALSAPAANAWNQPHTVTVTAVQDTFDETDPHSATITHAIVGYGAITTVPPVAVTVVDNNPPVVTTNTGLTLGRSTSAGITSAMLAATDAETPAADLLFTVILAPGQGTLLRNGVALGNTSTFTMGDISAGLIAYQNSGTPNTIDGFAFRVSDAIGNEGDLTIFDITVTGYIPPTITFGSGDLAFTEGDPYTAIDVATAVSDPDSVRYTLLTVDLPTNGEATDELHIHNFGAVGIGQSGGNVTYNGAVIGTYTGGVNGDPLVVSFSPGAAGDTEVAALVAAIEFHTASENPSGLTRTLRLVLRDETGTDSVATTKQIAVTPVNDTPAFADMTIITPTNVAITATLNVVDVDTYPLTLEVIAAPGKGTLSGCLDVLAPTALASGAASTAFTYTPSPGQSGNDSFQVRVTDPLGAQATATISVLIVGGAAARPWITTDPPMEAEAGAPLAYDIELDTRDLASTPIAGQVTYSLVGTLPTGVTANFTPNGINATLTLTIPPSATGVIQAGIVVTDTANNSTGFQPLTIQIVPAGSLGG